MEGLICTVFTLAVYNTNNCSKYTPEANPDYQLARTAQTDQLIDIGAKTIISQQATS